MPPETSVHDREQDAESDEGHHKHDADRGSEERGHGVGANAGKDALTHDYLSSLVRAMPMSVCPLCWVKEIRNVPWHVSQLPCSVML